MVTGCLRKIEKINISMKLAKMKFLAGMCEIFYTFADAKLYGTIWISESATALGIFQNGNFASLWFSIISQNRSKYGFLQNFAGF